MAFIDGYNLKRVFPVRENTDLTNEEEIGNIIDINDANRLVLYIQFTKGEESEDTAEVKIEFSTDKVNWYQETKEDLLITHTFSDSGNYKLIIPVMEKYVRVSVKGPEEPVDGKMQIDALVGTA